MTSVDEGQSGSASFGRWSVRTAHDAVLLGRGVRLEHSSVPAIEGLGVADLAEWHTAQTPDARLALRVGPDEEGIVGPAGTLVRWFDYLDQGVARRGLTAYAPLGGAMHWVVAETEPGAELASTDEASLIEAVDHWLQAQAAVSLTALELRVLAELFDLPQVHFVGAAWYPDLAVERRLPIGDEVCSGLFRRGVLRPDPQGAGGVVMSDAVEPLVRAVLDGDHVVVATRTPAGAGTAGVGDDTVVLALGADGTWVALTDEPDGTLRIAPVFRRLEQELQSFLDLGEFVTGVPTDERDRITTVAELRSALTDEAAGWRSRVGVMAIRRSSDGLQMCEFAWLRDARGVGWSVEVSLESGDVQLVGVGRAAIAADLRSALEPSQGADVEGVPAPAEER